MEATPIIIFLGFLLNAISGTIAIPQEKIDKAINMIEFILSSKKVTVLDMQRITGLLNFFCCAIVPGRAFMRRLYASYAGNALRQHQHLKVNGEMKLDLMLWKDFLLAQECVSRPFVDFDDDASVLDLQMTSDAAKAVHHGYAAFCQLPGSNVAHYCFDVWEAGLITLYDPSVQFLELFALSVGILLFAHGLKNKTVHIYCDNMAVVQMVNNGASACRHCMLLIRRLTLCALFNNIKFEVRHVSSRDNTFSDLLSRNKHQQFLEALPVDVKPCRLPIPRELLPISKFYQVYS